jgi:hypothetical protein
MGRTPLLGSLFSSRPVKEDFVLMKEYDRISYSGLPGKI